MGFGDTFLLYQYTDDGGSNYDVKLAANVAAAGGWGTGYKGRTNGPWIAKHKDLRHVSAVAPSGQKVKLPIASNTNTLYTVGGTFSLHGLTYSVEGIFGEKKPSPL
jgi:hypothetical protein